ncbi:TonB-dependent siderophore receptor [Agrobacterium leguminum]|uniref:Outer membrane siderophore receptor n=1 Tax=Agrobacterium deltaense NCPPB 1641 TaxID=1183425 RepID=A0A1S7TU80_9HYPH|nr:MULTISPECIES: TonB-dependent siderophore receptor [Agrobacterium]WFS68491.1 TonB-dependent siderophore receptor [Agrobacterium leguminum]CVI58123.1 Outer membrane siderophore receptor [Agrobacterium deltaense NCPPB 1641]
MSKRKNHFSNRHSAIGSFRILLLATVAGLTLTGPLPAAAQTAAQASALQFSIAPQPLSSALVRYSSITGVDVVFNGEIPATVRTAGVTGAFSRKDALTRLLAGTGLSYTFTSANTVRLSNPGAAAAPVAGSTLLQPIELTGNRGGGDNATVAAKNSSGATKLDTPLIETPRSVAVVTKKEMQQRGVQDIIEAVRYSAGVTTGTAAGFDPRFDQIYIRGYDATTMGDYKDGLRQPYLNYGMFRTDPYSLERVEIVRGPISVLYGAGTPAGIVNKTSKLANGTRIREVEALYGTETRKQAAFDIGDTIDADGTLSYRVVGLARAGDTNFDIADDRYFLQPSFTWKPSDQTSLTVYGLIQSTETDASVAALTDPAGNVLRLRGSDPDYDYQKIRQQQVGYNFEHEFNDTLTFRQNLRYSHMDLRSRYLSVSSWTGTVAHRDPWAIRDDMKAFQADNQLEWSFDTGPVSHTLLTGLDYSNVKSSFAYGYASGGSAFDFDIANPRYGFSGPTPAYSAYQSEADLRQVGLYALDQMELDKWRFTLGGRQTWVDQTRQGPVTEDVQKDAFTVQAGALYAFDNGVSPFFSYATSFDPVTKLSATGETLKPTEGEQFELGVKYQPPGTDIMLSAVAYHLAEKNKPVAIDPAGLIFRSLGEVTNKGFELEAKANIAAGWDVIAAYSYTHSRITAGDDAGNTPSSVPTHVASLWANYTFQEDTPLHGLSAGAGLRYVGESYTSTKNIAKNDAAIYLDAALSYDFGALDKDYDGLVASFNVRNIADDRNVACTDGYCYLGQGRNITASLKYRW